MKDIEEKKVEQIQNGETVSEPKKQKSKFKKILSVFWKLIACLLIIFLITISVRALVFKKYDVFGYRCYLIMSGSMEPIIGISDLVITKETDNLNEGDIIAFYNKGSITVHRIIETSTQENGESLYQTKGDNNNSADSDLVKKSQVKGEVVCKIPKVGDAIIFLKKHLIIILILTLGILLIISLIRRLI